MIPPSLPPTFSSLPDAVQKIEELEQALLAAEIRAVTGERRLFQLVNQLDQGVLLINAAGTIALINEQYCQLTGLAEPEQWLGRPSTALLDHLGALTEQPALQQERIRQVRANRQTVRGQEVRFRNGCVCEQDYMLVPSEAGEGPAELICYRDVTQQRRTAAALESMSRIPEQNPNPVIRVGADHKPLFANQASRRLWRLLSLPARHFLVRELRRATTLALANDLIDRRELAVDAYWLMASVVPYPLEGYVNVYILDVTTQHQTQEALRQREAQLREQQQFTDLILNTTPNAIFVRNAKGQVLFQNRALVGLRARAPHIDGPYDVSLDTVQARELKGYAATEAHVLATGAQVVTEDPLTLSSGEVRWFQSVKRPLPRPDGTTDVLIVSTDITDVKRAHQILAHSEKQYRDLMHYSPTVIVTHDLGGILLSCNPASATLLQGRKQEIIGHSLAEFLPPDNHPSLPGYLAHIASSREWSGVFTLQTRDGSCRHLLCHNYRVDEPGQPSYVIAHSQDITERLLAERAMKRAKEAAEVAVRARENFLANMSHEIRTPMNGVLGMARQLTKTPLTPPQQELLRVITSSGQHLLAVLNDILDMAKIASGKLELAQLPFNLCDSMSQAVQPLVLQAQEKGLTIQGTLLRETCPVPWVVGDSYRVNQVLINLVSNAIKFTPAGGTITVSGYMVQETETHLTTEFCVADTGIGIAPDKLTHIFEDFTQAYADITRQFGGTGLGLSICRALVARLGGCLTVESTLGEGSTFRFTATLPRARPADVAALTAPTSFDSGELHGRRMLVVEDNEINREVARMLLEEWGVHVDEASDGSAALAMHARHHYAVILMDIQMPGMSGVEATLHIRRHAERRRAQVPVLALTANAFRADNERYLAAGMNACLTKPFEEAELYRTLVRLLPPHSMSSYDLTHLRKMAHGKQDFVYRIVRSFLTNMPTTTAQIRAAAAAANWDKVAELVHHVKPNLTQLGIADVAQQVQLLAQAPNPQHPLIEARQLATEHLLRQLELVLQELPTELPRPA